MATQNQQSRRRRGRYCNVMNQNRICCRQLFSLHMIFSTSGDSVVNSCDSLIFLVLAFSLGLLIVCEVETAG